MIADLKRIFSPLPVYLSNDLTAAGFRYVQQQLDSFCVITVSTGVGSKVFINGLPQLGPKGTGGEIGHAKVLFSEDAPVCDCGEPGHLQAIASGRGVLEAIQRQARKEPENFSNSFLGKIHSRPETVSNVSIAEAVSNVSIAEAFRASDPFTVEIINECMRPLAAMLVNLHLGLGLDRFIIIGGFAFALGESYRLCLAKQAAALCWDDQAEWQKMIQFGLEDDLSGLVGAGRLANLDLRSSE
jgi:glucokinase